MPRILGSNENKLTIADALSGTDIVLHYRMPTTQERVQYRAEAIKRTGSKVEDRSAETRLKFGRKILVGFREGDFLKPDGNPLVWGDGDWMDQICEQAADLVEILAVRVFEQSAVALVGADDEEQGDADRD